MKTRKFKAGKTPGTSIVEATVTESEIMSMARILAKIRLNKGHPLEEPKQVFAHLQMLLQNYEHEVFDLLMLDSKNSTIKFHELFRGT